MALCGESSFDLWVDSHHKGPVMWKLGFVSRRIGEFSQYESSLMYDFGYGALLVYGCVVDAKPLPEPMLTHRQKRP